MKASTRKRSMLPFFAAVIAAAAALILLVPKLLQTQPESADTPSAVHRSDDGSAVVLDTASVSGEAAFYDYDANGITVELFAVKATDGSIRLAPNTCQVCSGSPYAYFVQEGDSFICQNCRNSFASTQVGLVSGGCNPVPIMEEDYLLQNGEILISTAFLEENAARFANWKNF